MSELTTPLLWPEMRREHFESSLQNDPVVVVPVGSIEQHGPHCPVDVDLSIPYHIALETAKRVQDFPLVIAPPIPFGFTHYNRGFFGTITLQLETFIALVSDVCLSIYNNGFKRIVLLNGHGGNHHPLRSIAVKLAEHNVFCLAFSHWELISQEMQDWGDKDSGIGHGGEWETSLQLYLRPHLVDRSKGIAESWTPSVDSAFEHFARFPERQRETPQGVMGDPTVASSDKGRRYVELAVERLTQLVTAYHHQPVRKYKHRALGLGRLE